MNVKLLRKVQQHITEEPNRLAMADWIQRKENQSEVDDSNLQHPFAACGTAGCIAGWILLLSGSDESKCFSFTGDAEKLLKMPRGSCSRMWYVSSWPDPFRTQYGRANTPTERAQIAVARIDHFINTNGKE